MVFYGILATAAAMLVVGVFMAINEYRTAVFPAPGEILMSWTFLAVVTGLLGTFLILLLGGLILPGDRVEADETYELKQLNLGSNLSGTFFLGSGTVDKEHSFMFYREGNGGYVLDSVPAEDVTIIEDSSTPRIEHNVVYMYEWLGSREIFGAMDRDYTIHVPPGSIATGVDINID